MEETPSILGGGRGKGGKKGGGRGEAQEEGGKGEIFGGFFLKILTFLLKLFVSKIQINFKSRQGNLKNSRHI